jgi:hypothetical protein
MSGQEEGRERKRRSNFDVTPQALGASPQAIAQAAAASIMIAPPVIKSLIDDVGQPVGRILGAAPPDDSWDGACRRNGRGSVVLPNAILSSSRGEPRCHSRT